MVEHFATLPCRLDRHREHFLDSLLTDELSERARTQREIQFAVFAGRFGTWSRTAFFTSRRLGPWCRLRRSWLAFDVATFHRESPRVICAAGFRDCRRSRQLQPHPQRVSLQQAYSRD